MGMFATIAGLVGTFAGLAVLWPEWLPAPAISRVANIDEKFRFLRERPHLDPKVLAIGSSITWRHLDGAEFQEVSSGRFLNGGLVHLKAHQTLELAKFYLDHYRNVEHVLVLTGLTDFEDCTDDSALLFDPDEAARYAFGGWPVGYFYARFFAPQRLLEGASRLPDRRTPPTGDMYIDAYGSGPVQVPPEINLGLRYGEIKFDPACTAALIEMPRLKASRGIRLTIVFTPVHPDYRKIHASSTRLLVEIAETIRKATRQDGTRILTMIDDPDFAPQDFFDALHLQWSAVPRLSRRIAETMRAGSIAEPREAHPQSAPASGALLAPAATKEDVEGTVPKRR